MLEREYGEGSSYPHFKAVSFADLEFLGGDWEDTIMISGVEFEVTLSVTLTISDERYINHLRPRLNGREGFTGDSALYADQGKSRRGFNFTNYDRKEIGVLWITFKTNKDFHFAEDYINGRNENTILQEYFKGQEKLKN
ncbi:hypothetical protein BTO06_05750 [Tenacibaculum sp. SZ-18]|nr:hypothetical protein BTO06_05750 [Tenacibaculum sp. SZ-18]